ncbi:high choriolytic enzyme 1-like [Trematomus bernacchii]|uniref:high choriolytic enzyme 1-like n=1 Tax=Trematomus bernacchii TaxID=40690 RepID=UPI00146C1D4D|nr:high choriolytic enzyme 1-like [Trematomus bernacchii]
MLCWSGKMAPIVILLCLLAILDNEKFSRHPEKSTGFRSVLPPAVDIPCKGWAYAFDKINTLNLNTPYDYNSVMQYHRYAFSGNNMPTMVPIPNANVEFGTANQMSRNDISRLNTLYTC